MRSFFVIAVSTLGAALVLMLAPVFDDDHQRGWDAGEVPTREPSARAVGCRLGCVDQAPVRRADTGRLGSIGDDQVR